MGYYDERTYEQAELDNARWRLNYAETWQGRVRGDGEAHARAKREVDAARERVKSAQAAVIATTR